MLESIDVADPSICLKCGQVDPVKAELYEALKGFLEWVEVGGPMYPIDQLERALARAEGREDV